MKKNQNQLTIFDYIDASDYDMTDYEKNDSFLNPIINELSKDIKRVCTGIRKEEYDVWKHVPKLGKRYSCFVDIENDEQIDKLNAIFEKYENYSLNITICHVLDMWFISSIWNTRSHKERSEYE